MPGDPPITVLMTVYNGLPYLEEAIDSILAQTFRGFEFLIVDDASTDASRELIASYRDGRIHLIANDQNVGQTRSLNRGLELARGEFVARLDHDDRAHPERLERQYAFLTAKPDVAIAGTASRVIDEKGLVIGKRPFFGSPTVILWTMLFECVLTHSSTMFRRSLIWNEFGGYDDGVRFAEDFDLWSRVAAQHRLANMPDVLTDSRYLESSKSRKHLQEMYDQTNQTILANVSRFLNMEEIPASWRRFLVAQNIYLAEPGTRATELSGALEEIKSVFVDRYPEVASEPEFKVHLAPLYWQIANLCPRDRVGSMKAWNRSRALDAAIGTPANFARLWALWLGGAEARCLYRRFCRTPATGGS